MSGRANQKLTHITEDTTLSQMQYPAFSYVAHYAVVDCPILQSI